MSGILAQLPDLGELESLRDLAQNGLGELGAQLDDPQALAQPLLDSLDPASQLPDLASMLAPLTGQASQLSALIPAGLGDQVTALLPQLEALRQSIQDGALAPVLEQLSSGQSINDLARAGLDLFLQQFMGQLPEMPAGLVSAAEGFLSAAGGVGALSSAEGLTDFLAEQLFNLPLEPLQAVAGVRQDFLSPLLDLQERGGSALDALEGAAAQALATAVAQLGDLDPTHASEWTAVEAALAQARVGMGDLSAALASLPSLVYGGLSQLNPSRLEGDLSAALGSLPASLAGQPAPRFTSLSGVVDEILLPLDELTARIAAGSPGDLDAGLQEVLDRLLSVFDIMAEAVQQNPVMDFFADLQEALQPVAQAIASVQETIQSALQGLKDAVDGLLAEFTAILDGLLAALQGFIQTLEAIDIQALVAAVSGLFDGLSQLLASLPLQEFRDALDAALSTLQGLIEQLSEVAAPIMQQVESLLEGLESIRFAPLAEPVIDAIRSISDTLAAIDPSFLPEALRGLLEEALEAFTSAFGDNPEDYFQTEIIDKLESAFDQAVSAVTDLFEGIQSRFASFLEGARSLEPESLLQPVVDAFGQVSAALDGLSAASLLAPVAELLDAALQELEALSPQALLGSLEEAFDGQVLAPLQAIKPSDLLQPLIEVFEELQALIGGLDFSEALQGLTESAGEFLGSVQGNLAGALDFSSLPGAGGASAAVQPVLAAFAPATPMEDWVAALESAFNSYRPSTFLEPVTTALQPLEAVLDGASDDLLVAVGAQLQGLRGASDVLSDLPGVLQGGLAALADALESNRPAAAAAGLGGGYQALRSAFDAVDPASVPSALQPRYQTVRQGVLALDPAVALAPLDGAYNQLLGGVRQAAAQPVDLGSLRAQYGGLLSAAGGSLPVFAAGELTPETVRQALDSLRPSALAGLLDERFDAFLAAAEGYGGSIEARMQSFLQQLGEKLAAISPAALIERFAELFQPVLDALQAVSPGVLAETLDEVYNDLLEALQAIHPRRISEALQAIFDAALGKLRELKDGLLSAVTQGIDAALVQIREALAALDPQAILASLGNLFDVLLDELEGLNLEQLFERLAQAFASLRDDLLDTLSEAAAAFEDMLEAVPV